MEHAAAEDAAAVRAAADRGELDALIYGWGDAYVIGRDDERGWHARRRDGRGGDITASEPETLWKAIGEDYRAMRVPRDLPGEGGQQ